MGVVSVRVATRSVRLTTPPTQPSSVHAARINVRRNVHSVRFADSVPTRLRRCICAVGTDSWGDGQARTVKPPAREDIGGRIGWTDSHAVFITLPATADCVRQSKKHSLDARRVRFAHSNTDSCTLSLRCALACPRNVHLDLTASAMLCYAALQRTMRVRACVPVVPVYPQYHLRGKLCLCRVPCPGVPAICVHTLTTNNSKSAAAAAKEL